MVRRVMELLQGIRIKNLLLLLLYHIIIYYKFFSQVNTTGFALLTLTVLLIAAAGNLENDLHDIFIDRYNRKKNYYHKPGRRIKKYLPYVFYVAGLISAAIFVSRLDMPGYMFYFIAIVVLLINYNTVLKKTPFIGNFVVSFLTALVVIQPVFFFPADIGVVKLLILIASLVFFINLNREIIKDIIDRKGDSLAGFQTLGVISVKTALQTVFFINVLIVILMAWLIFSLQNPWAKIYYTVLGIYLIYIMVHTARIRKFMWQIKKWYKWSILAGILGILFV